MQGRTILYSQCRKLGVCDEIARHAEFFEQREHLFGVAGGWLQYLDARPGEPLPNMRRGIGWRSPAPSRDLCR
jgi:hypothetical protein